MSEIERKKFTMVQNSKENYPTRERTLAYSRSTVALFRQVYCSLKEPIALSRILSLTISEN